MSKSTRHNVHLPPLTGTVWIVHLFYKNSVNKENEDYDNNKRRDHDDARSRRPVS